MSWHSSSYWRAKHDEDVAAAKAEAASWEQHSRGWKNLFDEVRADYGRLLEKYHELKLAGAVPERAPVVRVTGIPDPGDVPQKPEPDELKALIHEKAGDNLRMRKMMLRQLAADRASGLSPEKIRAQIENGVQSDGVPV